VPGGTSRPHEERAIRASPKSQAAVEYTMVAAGRQTATRHLPDEEADALSIGSAGRVAGTRAR
jgi:hypothetical protein